MNAAERAAPDGPPAISFRALPREGPVGKGEWLPQVRFTPDVRNQLTALVDVAVISRLEEIAAVAPALARTNVSRVRWRLEEQRRAVRLTLLALDRSEDLTHDLVTGELTLRGWDAAKFMANLREGLGELEQAIAAIEKRAGKHRGGAPANSAVRWLVEQTERELRQAGIVDTYNEDGALAKILRILWPPVLGHDAPIELRPWFKYLKSRR